MLGIFNPKRLPKVSIEATSLQREKCKVVPQNVVCLAAVAAAAIAKLRLQWAAFRALSLPNLSSWADISEAMVSKYQHWVLTLILWLISVYNWSKIHLI